MFHLFDHWLANGLATQFDLHLELYPYALFDELYKNHNP